ncbi:MAG: DsrE family protein [Nitrospirae bacterium]|nr:DsrE family protein [Nitrospirota bacterium]MCL5284905.1 DsrE family protein [Nitrospirota bacterium]
MGKHKNVVFVLEASPTAHLRFFEGLRMALGFSVSHRPVTLVLLGEGVRILLPIAPKLLGLPPEIVEVIPLLNELGVHVVALDSELDRVFLDRPVPDFVTLAGKGDIQKIVSSADLVIPILRRIE